MSDDQKAIRIFRCKRCGHKMRYGASRCGSCGGPTPHINRDWLPFGIGVAVFMLILLKFA